MQINFYQAQAIGCRDEQQDALGNLVLTPQQKLYVLADGMGGQTGGQTASSTVVNAFLAYFQQHGGSGTEADLQHALQAANRAVAAVLQQRPELNGMGTTVIAVVVDEAHNRYRYISVGDSPLYVLRHGRLQRINANHAFAEDLKKMVASGEMSAAEAECHPARHAVTSAITGGDIAHIDCQSGSLAPGDKLLLASDGVQTLNDAEIENTLNTVAGNLEAQTNGLLAVVAAKQHPHQDNVSLLLIQAADTPGGAPATEPQPGATQVLPQGRGPAVGGRHVLRVAAIVLLLCCTAAAVWLLRQALPAPQPSAPSAAADSASAVGADGLPAPLPPTETTPASAASQ